MPARERFTVSIEPALSAKLETLMRRTGEANRSKMVSDLVRARLVEEEWDDDRDALGTITLLYDHHRRQLLNALADVQHDYHDQVLCATHVHLSHSLCAEVIIVRGRAEGIRALADRMRRLKGVLHCTLGMSSTGERLL